MCIGNAEGQEVLKKFFLHFQQNANNIPFLLVEGSAHIGKTTILYKHIHTLLGKYTQQDFLYLQDFSEKLSKQHTLRVDTPKNAVSEELKKTYNYQDIGMRDLISRLSKSPVGNYKIVLLENIQRMTIGAANALLKSCEEPFSRTLIIATIDATQNILDTITSRAFIVRFSLVSERDIADFLRDHYNLSPDQQATIITLTQGKIGLAKKFADDMLAGVSTDIVSLRGAREELGQKKKQSKGSVLLFDYFTLLQKIEKIGYLQIFIDILLSTLLQNTLSQKEKGFLTSCLQIKKHLQAHGNTDALLLKMSLVFVD